MKRHPSLRDLSVDHHHGLVHAHRLSKAAGDAVTGEERSQIALDFVRYFSEEANRHFREEEEVLFPAFARHGDPAEPTIVRVLVEHVRLRRLVDDLRTQLEREGPSRDTMREAGTLLRDHIRLEEDVVFPLVEQALPEDELKALFDRLTDFARTGKAF